MNVYNRVENILKELSQKEVILPESELQNDLGFDSLLMVTLLIEIEDNFEIQLDESDMNPFNLITVQHVVNLAEKYVGGGEGDENEKES